MKHLALLFAAFLALPISAQTTPPATPPVAVNAPYLIGFGGSVTQHASPAASGWFVVAKQTTDIAGLPIYIFTRFDLTPRYTSTRFGAEMKLIESGRFILTTDISVGEANASNGPLVGAGGFGGTGLFRLNKVKAVAGQTNEYFVAHAELIQVNMSGPAGGANAKLDLGFIIAFH